MRATPKAFLRAEKVLREHALSYPESHEDHPWGETAIKVAKKKVFLFMGNDEESWGISVKIPDSASLALNLPFASPTGYGLGKSGWVSARFAKGEGVPVEMLKEWIDESYRAVAPARLVKALSAPAPKQSPAKKSKAVGAKKKSPTAKKAGTRKSK